ncbi:hypothetical protein [Cronobacter turicensis]|uniref:hypothetical protein n=1 Tax=Cronobacter turicensis TaxID=413502 RepID=UPI0024AEE17A|nr:hypothetical protein [Cronobacter turicensis]MDI7416095.1 hypothetical protein [Cronobacter turicensis]MDI7496020.1 hypothetical protein [Cronobacter turicensis]MDI7498662.1 hypothetical protein [Cronobacter turicensis]
MKRPIAHKNDRMPAPRTNHFTPEARQRVINGLVATAKADFVSLVCWLKIGKQDGEPIPLNKCESLRTAILNLETLKAGVHTDWKQAIRLMEKEIKKSHQLDASVPASSQLVTGVLRSLNDISEKIAAGKAVPEMLGRLENMHQMIANIKGNESLVKSISILTRSVQDALRGYRKTQPTSKIRKPEKANTLLHDEQSFCAECAPLIGERDILIIASCLISMSARLGQSPVSLAKRAAALKGVIKTELLPELLELLQQDVELNALVPLHRDKDDNTRSDGGKLVGLTGVVEGGSSIGVEAQRIITAELKKLAHISGVQRIYLDTARLGLALENDTFKVIEEIKRIAGKYNWSPLSVAVYATYKTPGIRPDIAGDVITLLAQDEALSVNVRR